jgi:hypothetical protein
MLFKEIIAIYNENLMRPINTLCVPQNCQMLKQVVHVVSGFLTGQYIFTHLLGAVPSYNSLDVLNMEVFRS